MRILLAEDDDHTAGHLVRALRGLGHEVLHAPDGHAALALGLAQPLDALVLDRRLPGIDGLSLLQALRQAGVTVPALFLTALGRIEDRVEGLNAGADDYLVKPFALLELVARLEAMQRRRLAQPTTSLLAGGLAMDLLARTVRRDGVVVTLQPREFRLLEELMRHAGRFVTRTMLLEEVWNFHFDPGTKIVETHMSRLRTKLNQGNRPDLIETMRSQGYRLLLHPPLPLLSPPPP